MNLGVVPGLAQRLHGALHRILHGPAHGVRRNGMAQLIHAGMPPLLLDDLLQAAVALGIQTALGRQRLLHGRHARIDARRLGQIVADPRLFRGLLRRGLFLRRLLLNRLLRRALLLGLRSLLLRPCRALFLRLLGGLLRAGLLRRRQFDHGGQRAGQLDGEVQLLARKAGDVEALQLRFVQRLTVGRDPGALLLTLRGGVGPGFERVAAQHPRRSRRVAAPGAALALEVHDLEDHVLGGLAHHVGIDDVGVALGLVALVIFVGADFIVLSGMLPQIQHAVAAHAAHARLEVAGFVFVRHDADAALLWVGFLHRHGLVSALVFHQQRLHPKIRFEGIVLLQNTNTQFARQHNVSHHLSIARLNAGFRCADACAASPEPAI